MSTPENTPELMTEALAIMVEQLKSLSAKGFTNQECSDILIFAGDALGKIVPFGHHKDPRASLAAGIEIVTT